MTDIVERLREFNAKVCIEAADEIERLRATIVAADREIKASHADADRLRAIREAVRMETLARQALEIEQLRSALGSRYNVTDTSQ